MGGDEQTRSIKVTNFTNRNQYWQWAALARRLKTDLGSKTGCQPGIHAAPLQSKTRRAVNPWCTAATLLLHFQNNPIKTSSCLVAVLCLKRVVVDQTKAHWAQHTTLLIRALTRNTCRLLKVNCSFKTLVRYPSCPLSSFQNGPLLSTSSVWMPQKRSFWAFARHLLQYQQTPSTGLQPVATTTFDCSKLNNLRLTYFLVREVDKSLQYSCMYCFFYVTFSPRHFSLFVMSFNDWLVQLKKYIFRFFRIAKPQLTSGIQIWCGYLSLPLQSAWTERSRNFRYAGTTMKTTYVWFWNLCSKEELWWMWPCPVRASHYVSTGPSSLRAVHTLRNFS